jgi:N-acetylglucosaminyldiphosphoundecaprenol N-acetyl-beta-D-mannosaminyltransferase
MSEILNVNILSVRKEDLITSLLKGKGIVVTPNIDHLIRLQKDKEFYDIYKKADYIVCDSRILFFLSKLTSQPIIECIPGSSLFPDFCLALSQRTDNKGVFIVGGTTQGTCELAKNRMNSLLKRNVIFGAISPPFGFEKDISYLNFLVNEIEESKAKIVAVGLGSPKQEKLILSLQRMLPNVDLYFGIGATIDFMSGERKRAPLWVQKLGMEWLYRAFQEPKRLFKRYLIDDLPFFWLLIKQKVGLYKDPFG